MYEPPPPPQKKKKKKKNNTPATFIHFVMAIQIYYKSVYADSGVLPYEKGPNHFDALAFL